MGVGVIIFYSGFDVEDDDVVVLGLILRFLAFESCSSGLLGCGERGWAHDG